MRYRITLKESVHNYTAVIFRDYQEPNFPRDQTTIAQKKLFSISNASNNFKEEMYGQSAFSITSIEEYPED